MHSLIHPYTWAQTPCNATYAVRIPNQNGHRPFLNLSILNGNPSFNLSFKWIASLAINTLLSYLFVCYLFNKLSLYFFLLIVCILFFLSNWQNVLYLQSFVLFWTYPFLYIIHTFTGLHIPSNFFFFFMNSVVPFWVKSLHCACLYITPQNPPTPVTPPIPTTPPERGL